MHFKPVILFATISSVFYDVQGYIVSGLNTHIAKIYDQIYQFGINRTGYTDPDWFIGRKNFDSPITVPNTDENVSSLRNSPEDDNKPKRRQKSKRERKERRERKMNNEEANADFLKGQHEKKVNAILEFLTDHYLSTNYIYDEVQRIMRQRKVKDELRRMVEYLEKPGKTKMKEEVLKCYFDKRVEETPTNQNQNYKTNNLVINVLKDPYNYGFIN